ncbi:hypothetical protein NMY22_g11041 [Coprinellus aureogranulatus]|nr:hypothetical protein NMY22_g11041 [Coprinellus aureogranulatus]
MPPKRKNPKSLANLRNQRKVSPLSTESPQARNETGEGEPAEERLGIEDVVINNQLDSMKPDWAAEEDEDMAGAESAEWTEIVDDVPALWTSKKLVRAGIWEAMMQAALSNKESEHLHDEVRQDRLDPDYIPKGKKAKTDKPRAKYATGPDISRKSKRSQQRYKHSWSTQGHLDDFVVQSRRPEASKTTPKDEPMDVDIPPPSFASVAPDGVRIRQETPEAPQLEFLDCEIRQESATPPPLLFDDEIVNLGAQDEASRMGIGQKRRRSVEIEEVEDEDAPGARRPQEDDTESECGSDSGMEVWEDELNETIAPSKADIRPWDVLRTKINHTITTKGKTLANSHLNQLMILRSFATLRLRGFKKVEASNHIALQWNDDVEGSAIGMARRIRALAVFYQRHEQLPLERRGGYKNARSLLKDEAVQSACRTWLTAQKVGSVTPDRFRNGLNDSILPGLNVSLKKPLCTKTALRWLIKLGWAPVPRRKGVYMDGHERADVIAYRTSDYLPKIKEYQRGMALYEGPGLKRVEPTLKPGEKEIIAVFQDESCFHANDFQTSAWLGPGQQLLYKKSRGRLIHASNFICESQGTLAIYDSEGNIQREALTVTYPGSNGDPWWDKKQLLQQINKVIEIFEELNPGKVALMVFDQSSAHAALPDDALKAFEMNKKDGGAQRLQRDTIIPETNPCAEHRGKKQEMTFIDANGKRVPKGLDRVLRERGFNLPAGLRAKCKPICPHDNTSCCMARILSRQDDFAKQISELEKMIVARGHLCMFLPKFHCELNPIEMFWGWVKYRYRQEAKHNFEAAKQAAMKWLRACPLDVIRRFINRSWRFTQAYELGLTEKAAAWAVRKYKGHRSISNRALGNLEALVN